MINSRWGDKRKGYAQSRETRDKILQMLVAYGIVVSESVDQGDNLLTESTTRANQTFDRWATLAGIGSNK